ncbi:MAG: zinc-binding dehydrogenase, partial [Terriglobales bacterium]
IRIKACAMNHLDLFIRRGLPGITLPHINGSDISGEVAEVGEYVTGLKAGQRVLLAPMVYCGHCQFCMSGQQNFCRDFSVLGRAVNGGNCEYIAVKQESVIPIVKDQMGNELTYDEAASVPLVFLTAWHMLVGRAGVKPGDIVLVLGGGSGVGSAAIQIAKLNGARVIATAGDENKLDQCRELGADYTINHRTEKIADEVKKITAKAGVDIVFEHVGKATWEESVKSLKYGGKLVTCGATTGPEASVNVNVLFGKQLSLLGSFMGTMGELHAVLKHVFSGALKPVVDKTYPLREAATAHARMEEGKQFGKIVLNP